MPEIDIRNDVYNGAPIEMKGNHEHFFFFRYSDCVFLKLKEKQAKSQDDKPEHTEQQKQWERNRRQLNKLEEDFFELRKAFVESIKERKSFKNWQNICIEYALKIGWCSYGIRLMADYDLKEAVEGKNNYRLSDRKQVEKFNAYYAEHAAGYFVSLIYDGADDCANNTFHQNNQWKQPAFKENYQLTLIYEFLCALGYRMSDEEKLWQEGTHPLQQANSVCNE